MNLRVRTTGFSRSAMTAIGNQCQMMRTLEKLSRVARTFVKSMILLTLFANGFPMRSTVGDAENLSDGTSLKIVSSPRARLPLHAMSEFCNMNLA